MKQIRKKSNLHKKLVLSTILVIFGVFVLVRLGLWQLDRLEWRRGFNAHYLSQISLPELDLNQNKKEPFLLTSEYRKSFASGKFDFSHQVYLQNQVFQNTPGYHVLTPFVLTNSSSAVMVDRGWISMDDLEHIKDIDNLSKNVNQIHGVIRIGETKNSYGRDPDALRDDDSQFWLLVNLAKLQKQVPYDLLPVYIYLETSPVDGLPYAEEIEIEITEGPHFGYAMQWFFFASLLGFGFPFLAKKMIYQDRNRHITKEDLQDDNQ